MNSHSLAAFPGHFGIHGPHHGEQFVHVHKFEFQIQRCLVDHVHIVKDVIQFTVESFVCSRAKGICPASGIQYPNRSVPRYLNNALVSLGRKLLQGNP